MSDSSNVFPGKYRRRIQIGIAVTFIGFLIFLLGARPEWFSLTQSPVIGYVQISVFIIGLGLMCLGAVVACYAIWQNYPKNIIADIGLRILATGFVVAAVSAFADVVGLGTRPMPYLPFFGHWQNRGVLIGQGMIILGILMMIPYKHWFGEIEE